MSDSENTNPLLLRELELYNWGPFGGLHRAAIDPRGSAIIGPTGSGKTTLVDALMTLIAQQPKYNLASTGGHESDRDLVSYIRGVAGAGNESGDNLHVARTKETVTALRARFANNERSLDIGALLWFEGTSNATTDLKRLWIINQGEELPLTAWLEQHREGGKRAVKQLAHDYDGFRAHDSKKSYLAQVRSYFEVGENAFTLLNRAAGLKQLNSIDEIFRELVLDDRAAFERAAEVAAEFDDLAAIHEELETARRQQQSLLPIERLNHDYLACTEQLDQQRLLQRILPIHFATLSHRLWGEQVTRLEGEIGKLDQTIEEQERQEQLTRGESDTLKAIYLKAGGSNIEQLKEQLTTQQKLTEERRRNATDYQRLTATLSLDETLSHAALQANQQRVAEQQATLEQQITDDDAKRLHLGADLVQSKRRIEQLREELRIVQSRPDSNLPSGFHTFRGKLAAALNLAEGQLPFVAELIEVKAEESEWRGAIERAIGGERLRILVPSTAMQTALDWVNSRNNHLHVKLQEASEETGMAKFFDDGYCRKLNFKPHPHREALKNLLARIDRHCVDSVRQLRITPHSMTVQGLMSDSRGRFEKQDQKPLTADWMTGFDNRDRLANLGHALRENEQQCNTLQTQYDHADGALGKLRSNLGLLQQLAELDYDKIDLPGAEAALASLNERLQQLTAPNSDVTKAKQQYDEVEQRLNAIRQQIRHTDNQRSALQERCRIAAENRDSAFRRIGEGLDDSEQQLAAEKLPAPGEEALQQLDRLERETRQQIESNIATQEKQLTSLQQKLVRQMGNAKNIDTGALAETGSELHDIPDYLERLHILNEEALPEKQRRFLGYLNQSSDQGVTQLLSGIDNEVGIIEERIEELNQTLRRVDFQPGCYLQLEPVRVTQDSLRKLQAAQRKLRSAALQDDAGESHYKALENMVALLRDAAGSRRTIAARALLDPRYRLQFRALELARADDKIINRRSGSQGGSGGEKEIIASYILTASLSYALCPEGSTRPLFGTIVLDEAFSKSSQAVAGRIISALREFGLHPLFVTPNKELRLLREHTRSAILVHRKGSRATLTDLTWEELEAHARKKMSAS